MAEALKLKIAKGILDFAPKFVSKSLALTPFALKSSLIERILKTILAQQQQDDELECLESRNIGIKVLDLGLSFQVSFRCERWYVTEYKSTNNQQPEVTFTANSDDLILIAAGKEDPDTLFFQRKLCIEGDTELGLEVKNLLLSIEFDTLPKSIHISVTKLAKALIFLQKKSQLQARDYSF